MKKILLAILIILGNLIPAFQAKAVCPVCTVAVGAGVGFSRWLGIDDTVSGLWIGGLTVSMIIWTINWLKKKNINFKWRAGLIFAGYYLLIVVPLYFTGIIGHPFNRLWGIDKIILGVAFGSVFFYLGDILYDYLKKKNGGHAHFPFEKVVMPIAPLILLSALFYFLTK